MSNISPDFAVELFSNAYLFKDICTKYKVNSY